MQERGGDTRKLDRAPGERYESTQAQPVFVAPTRRSRVLAAVAAAAAGGLVTFLLAGLDVGAGLLAVGATTGWLTGLGLAGGPAGHGIDAGRGRATLAGIFAGAGLAAGVLADGVRALTQGGVLAPWVYAGERFGPLALVIVIVAVLAGGVRGR